MCLTFLFFFNQGLGKLGLLTQPSANPWSIIDAYCEQLFGNEKLMAQLRGTKFDVAIVDIVYNECGLALARDLGLPVVGYWAFSFSGCE